MTHTAPMADSEGGFGEPIPVTDVPCRKCKSLAVSYRVWESNCGGYEDYQYRCLTCGCIWWIDGIDS